MAALTIADSNDYFIRWAIWQNLLSGAKAGITYVAHGIWSWHEWDKDFPSAELSSMSYPLHIAWRFSGSWNAGYTLPNFGDEFRIANALDEEGLEVPILVHAEDEDNGKVDSHVFTRELERFARICRVVQELPHTHFGQVGPRPAAFNTVRAREKFLQVAGITVVPADLSEIILAAQGLKDGEQAVKDKLMEIHNYGTALASIAQENVLRKAKLCVALNRWIEANENDACAARCWSSIPTNYG